ncbi:hypothetical protein C8F04DRAFT_1202642 [Mycena alexandri]|uniref:Uncharacterized protein n=1 Tax=Mycena alexandri TaxID=1745969 RepID=A0AAD6RZX7_9AGAR|nr:hypothetical protein C8F04DRAFT_1202642 [Mycena alexandri]
MANTKGKVVVKEVGGPRAGRKILSNQAVSSFLTAASTALAATWKGRRGEGSYVGKQTGTHFNEVGSYPDKDKDPSNFHTYPTLELRFKSGMKAWTSLGAWACLELEELAGNLVERGKQGKTTPASEGSLDAGRTEALSNCICVRISGSEWERNDEEGEGKAARRGGKQRTWVVESNQPNVVINHAMFA